MSSQSISFRPAAVIKQLPWSLDKKAAVGLLLILATFSLVGWLYLGQASVITSSSLQIDRLRQEVDLLHQKNSELALEIAELESIGHVEERARALGFAPTNPASIRYLTVNSYPPADAAEAPAGPSAVPASKNPVWQIWLDNVTTWIAGNSE